MPVVRPTAMLAGLALAAALADPAGAMSAYQWKKRPLVVFATSDTEAALARQRSIVAANRGGMSERDMVIVWIVGDIVTVDGGPGPGLSARAMRRRYGIEPGAFRALLIGKDGGVKISTAMPISAAMMFSTIDAMPMRRDEMRRR